MEGVLRYEDFKNYFLDNGKPKLEVGDLIKIPYKKPNQVLIEEYYDILFYIINKETIGGCSYIDIMSMDFHLMEPMVWLTKEDLENQKSLTTTLYHATNVAHCLNELVKRFPEPVQRAMESKQIRRYSDKGNGERYERALEQIGKIWALDTDEVFDHRTTHTDFNARCYPYVLDQFPFFKTHPNFFDGQEHCVILRNQIIPGKVSFIARGFLFTSSDLYQTYITPICMRLQIDQ